MVASQMCDPSCFEPLVAKINEVFKKFVAAHKEQNDKVSSLELNKTVPYSGDNPMKRCTSDASSLFQLYQLRNSFSQASEALFSTISQSMPSKDRKQSLPIFTTPVIDQSTPASTSEYKRIAVESTLVLDAFIKMLKANFAMLREIPLIPADPVFAKAQEITQLVIEARGKFGQLDNIQRENDELKAKCAALERELAKLNDTGAAVQVSKSCDLDATHDSPAAAPNKKSTIPACESESYVYNNMYGSAGGISPGPNRRSAFTVSSRYQKFEALYYEIYEGSGMEMIWNCVDTVFRCAYDKKAILNKEHDSSLVSEANDENENIPHFDQASYQDFYQDFNSNIVKRLSTEEAFNAAIRNITPIRSDYISNCSQCGVKPNSGVVRLLSRLLLDRAIISLDLSGNYLGDSGIFPLLPILSRMHQLTTLNLSHNGLRNDGVTALCKAVTSHPSIASIDLSHNDFSRAGGKSVLTLANAVPRISYIKLEETNVDGSLKQRILLRVLENFAGVREESEKGHRRKTR